MLSEYVHYHCESLCEFSAGLQWLLLTPDDIACPPQVVHFYFNRGFYYKIPPSTAPLTGGLGMHLQGLWLHRPESIVKAMVLIAVR